MAILEASPWFGYDVFISAYNFLILQHEKVKNLYSQKMHVKWKIFDLYVKNYIILSIFTLFQLLLWSSFAFLKTALWFHFSENGPFEWLILLATIYMPIFSLIRLPSHPVLKMYWWKRQQTQKQFFILDIRVTLILINQVINRGSDVINPFVPNAPFLYPLRKYQNRKILCFNEVKKGYAGNEWFNLEGLFQGLKCKYPTVLKLWPGNLRIQ